jgi:hypothetical protein
VTTGAWQNAVTVALTAADNAGNGVAHHYAVDGGAPIRSPRAPLCADRTSGAHTITFFATDVISNTEAAQALTVNIDASKPRQGPRCEGAPGARRRCGTRSRRHAQAGQPGSIAIKNRRGKVEALRLGDGQ